MREKVQKHPWIFLHFLFFVVSLNPTKKSILLIP